MDMQHADFASPNQAMDNYLLRLASYDKLPDWAVLSPMKAAKSGLYYTGEGDTVACYSCGLRLNHWESGVHPMTLHRRLSPQRQCVASQPTDDGSAEQDDTEVVSAEEVMSQEPEDTLRRCHKVKTTDLYTISFLDQRSKLVSLTRLSVGCGTTLRRQSGHFNGFCLFIRVIYTTLPPHGHCRNILL